jgi:hypothetical protein
MILNAALSWRLIPKMLNVARKRLAATTVIIKVICETRY